jgi:hypothetical protein
MSYTMNRKTKSVNGYVRIYDRYEQPWVEMATYHAIELNTQTRRRQCDTFLSTVKACD